MRPVFGFKGALVPDFGTTASALLVFEGDRYPTMAFPRTDQKRGTIRVEQALEELLAERATTVKAAAGSQGETHMAEYLPPRETWPARIYTLPEFQAYADRFSPTEELLGKAVAAGRGGRAAVLFDDQTITYGQLLTQANKFGNSLRELGVTEGDRVILRMPNIPPALVANFATLKLGAVVTPTSPLFSRTEIAHVANDSEAVAIVVSAMLLGEVEAARENFKTVGEIIVIGGDVAEVKAKGFRPDAELLQAGSAQLDPVPRKREDVGLLLYTSGTTGRPKGTVHLVEELLIIPDTFLASTPEGDRERTSSVAPRRWPSCRVLQLCDHSVSIRSGGFAHRQV